MGNPLPQAQTLPRQKWSGGQQQKWDSGFSSGTRSNGGSNPSSRATAAAGGGGGIVRRQPSSSERAVAARLSGPSSGDVNPGGRQRTLLIGEQPPMSSSARHHHQQHYHHHPPGNAPMSGASSCNSNSITTTIAMRDAATNTEDSSSPCTTLVAEVESSSGATTSSAAAAAAAARDAFRSGRFRTSVRSKRGERTGEATELLPKEPQQQEELPLCCANAEEEVVVVGGSGNSGGAQNSSSSSAQPKKCSSFRDGLLRRDSSGGLESFMEGLITPTATSAQTEKEGSHSRLLSRGGESSSFRGKQISTSSFRRESSSFRRETVSSSFRKDVGGSRRKERKNTKSFQDGDVSSIASESGRGSPCSIHYNQAPFPGKGNNNSHSNSSSGIPPPHGLPWASSPSSPDNGFAKSAVPFQWEEAPGKAKTIAAAAEMALARKLVRDESLRRLNAASPRSSIDSHGSFRIEKASSSYGGTRGVFPEHQQQQQPSPPPQPLLHSQQPPQQSRQEQQQLSSSGGPLPLPPSKRPSQELAPPRKDSHSSQLLEDLKAAVVRKQAEESSIASAIVKAKPEAPVDDDTKSVISDYCGGETQIDLVAPAAAKILNREDDVPIPTPVKAPLAAVPFKWEEAPGKPKENTATSGSLAEPPSLSLPPRLLGGCHNPSKEQAAKILQTYSCNLMDMHWTSSGNPTPLSRSRDATPTRRDRTPTRRDRTPTKRDITPGRREVTPTRRDSTPTRTYFPSRALPKSGPITLPSVVVALESVRDHHSGPLRSNTNPNYLNVPPRSVSQEFARVTQDSALTALTQDLESSNRTTSDAGSLPQLSYRSSKGASLSRELQIVKRDSSPDVSSVKRSSDSGSRDSSSHKCKAIVRVTSTVDPSSPTSILCGPDVDSSQRTVSNLSSAYAESSHSHLQETVSNHTKSDSCTSLESFVDETYNMPPPWSDGEPTESPYRDLGPTDLASGSSQGNNSIEDGVKAIVRFCKKAKKWNKSKNFPRKNSAEPDMWAPTLATYFQKIELGGAILGKVGSQVFPESKDVKTSSSSAPAAPAGATPASVPCSPLRFIPRSGELPATPDRDRLGARKPMGSMTPVHVITTCRSPSYRVMATDECLSVFCIGKVLSATKARHAKWGRKMRKSSRLMGAIFAALKRSMLLKCGRQSLPNIPSDKNLLDRNGDVSTKEHTGKSPVDAVHSLSADHQFHRPL